MSDLPEIPASDQLPVPLQTSPQPAPPAASGAKRGAGRKGIGGTYSHSPNCQCRPCKARHRQEEAVALTARSVGATLAPDDGQALTQGLKKPKTRGASKSLRERTAQYLCISAGFPNITKTEIAKKMGIGRQQLFEIIRDAQASGILKFDDALDRVEFELIPKVLDNLSY